MRKLLLLAVFGFFLCPIIAQTEFITTWKTDNPGSSADNQITIPTFAGETYDYNVDWGDGNSDTNITGNITHTYAVAGTYQVTITGTFPRIYFHDSPDLIEEDKNKILSIDQWGTIQWSSMRNAFYGCENLDVLATDSPDLSSVTDMVAMFRFCSNLVGTNAFSTWDVGTVTAMLGMFEGALLFNQDIGNWDVSSVTNMSGMFWNATSFNQDLSNWDVSNVTTMVNIFALAGLSTINYDLLLNGWAGLPSLQNNVSFGAGIIKYCQAEAARQNIINTYGWNITDGGEECPFITTWKTDNPGVSDSNSITIPTAAEFTYNYSVDWGDGTFSSGLTGDTTHTYSSPGTYTVSIYGQFPQIKFLDQGDKEKILTVESWGDILWNSLFHAFHGCSNLVLNATDIPSIDQSANMQYMFRKCSSLVGNPSMSMWDVSGVTNMDFMFREAPLFNQDISGWDVSSVRGMRAMFLDAVSFNQDLSAWDISSVQDMDRMFLNVKLSTENYDNMLQSWSQLSLQSNVPFDGGGSQYCEAVNARQAIIDSNGWIITDGGASCPFVTSWKTDNPGSSADNQITIPTFPGETYNYTVDWGDGNSDSNVSGSITHTYATPGTYVVAISGTFPRIYFNLDPESEKLLSVDRWGDIQWSSMENAFANCMNMDVTATDIPDFTNLTSLRAMFRDCSSLEANSTINNWDTSTVSDMALMFAFANLFNQDISDWDTSAVITMNGMFTQADSFNQPIGTWNTSNVQDMGSMFNMTGSFNQDISSWDVSKVSNMFGMFLDSQTFNQDLNGWDTGNVVNMGNMFQQAQAFNGNINNWDVSSVTNMVGMFDAAPSFNQPLNNWDVSSVTNMFAMFADAVAFNQPLGNWDVGSVTDMTNLFLRSNMFDQDLGNWDVSQVTTMIDMFRDAGLSQSNYDSTLVGWSNLPSLQNGVQFNAGNSTYCRGEVARIIITDTYGWMINDIGKDCPFVTTWKTDNPGISDDNQIIIPLFGGPFNIDWGDGTVETNLFNGSSHTYATSGVYTVSISGTVNAINFEGFGGSVPISDELKLLEINQWGSIVWTTMSSSFSGCKNLEVLATDIPNLSQVTSMFSMFNFCESIQGNESFNYWDVSMVDNLIQTFGACTLFDADISSWDTSKVTDMTNLFFECENFNQDISNWNVSNVTNMSSMFSRATSFNQDIGNWDVSNVTDMGAMFQQSGFNSDITNWDVSNVKDMRYMFNLTTAFDQDISVWNVSNVENMEYMFSSSEVFNRDISNWDVSKVTSMRGMFNLAKSFNRDISEWDVSSVTDMYRMFFRNNTFDQDIGDWDISQVTDMTEMFAQTSISIVNYDSTLNGWGSLPGLQSDVVFDGGSSVYCESADARQNLIDTYNWTIIDAGESALCNVDNDVDGVADHIDSCLDTRPGVEVNSIGCEIIPVSSIRVIANTTSCPGESNGSVIIETDLTDLEFNIQITGSTTNDGIFQTVIFPSYEFENLPAGDYIISLSIPTALFEQQYGIQIRELNDVTGRRQVIDRTKRSATYVVSGSREYQVELNGKTSIYSVDSVEPQLITIDNLEQNNRVLIKGASDCQGLVEDTFDLDLDLLLYPVLTSGEVFIDGPLQGTSLRIYDIYGRLIKSQDLRSDNEPVFDLDGLPDGVYLVQITNDGMTKTHKIIKQ